MFCAPPRKRPAAAVADAVADAERPPLAKRLQPPKGDQTDDPARASKAPALHESSLYKDTVLQLYMQAAWSKSTHAQKITIKENLKANEATFTSMCSGTGMAEVVFHALHELVEPKALSVHHSCEIVPFKQGFLSCIVHPALQVSDSCVFKDIQELSLGSGSCAAHDMQCDVKMRPFLSVTGYSCKNLSALNSQNSKPRSEILT